MTDKPQVLVISGVWPLFKARREAAHVVCHEIVRHLALSGSYKVSFLYVNSQPDPLTSAAKRELESLRSDHVTMLKPFLLGPAARPREKLTEILPALLKGCLDDILPHGEKAGRFAARVAGICPDVVLTVWCESAQTLASRLPTPKIAYSGNPDHKVLEARLELADSQRRGPARLMISRLLAELKVAIVRHAHLKVMRRYDSVLNVACNDAEDYARAGVKAAYVQNMWPADELLPDWEAERDRKEQISPIKIVANVGNLSATGNTYGLLTTVKEILPALKKELGEGAFELHLFGGGNPHPSVAPLLDEPHIRLRGFIEDLNAEILSSPVFLVSNNHHKFKVGHTRFLHAWSLGSCCVAFNDSRLAMPEIVDGENALLGRDSAAVAHAIVQAASDRGLRRRIGAGGLETLKRHFAPSQVVRSIEKEIRNAIA